MIIIFKICKVPFRTTATLGTLRGRGPLGRGREAAVRKGSLTILNLFALDNPSGSVGYTVGVNPIGS